MKLLVKLTSRQRPAKFFAALDNIVQLIGNVDYYLIATLDLDDPSMNNDLVKERLRDEYEVIVFWGLSKNKIHAYNRGVPETDWDVLVATSDDMLFTGYKFGETIMRDMEYFGNDNILHYPDGRQNERLITLPIIGRKYYDRTKKIYNDIYNVQFADNEQMAIAKKLNCYRFLPKEIFYHYYPKTNEPKDELYQRNEKKELIAADKKKYFERLQNNFA